MTVLVLIIKVAMQDQDDLDEARRISVLNRQMRSGDIITDDEQLKNNAHTLQVSHCHQPLVLAHQYGDWSWLWLLPCLAANIR